NMSHTFTHRITSELGENIGHGNLILLTGLFNISDDFRDHELIIIFKTKRMLYWKTAPDIYGVEFGTDLLQLTVQIDDLIELTPVIDIVFDALVKEYMEHLQLKPVFIAFNL